MSLNAEIKSVKELTNDIKTTLETAFPYVWVRGELGPVKLHSSGHRYFSLKEEDSVINGICWRGTPLSIELEEGKIVECYAKVTIFGGRSSYQIIAKEIREVSSKGDILLKLEELKKKLMDEGIFSIKKTEILPKFPKSIAILTSPTGAVLHDMMHRINDRFPCVSIKFLPINVQGADSKKSILEGLLKAELLNVDVVILARGGGSLEDLWIFNDEDIVRKVATLNKPIITAIGHETDTTLVDYASTLRAPTPTAAIELCVPDRSDLVKEINVTINNSSAFSYEKVISMKKYLEQFSDINVTVNNAINSFYQKIDNLLLVNGDYIKEKVKKNELALAEFDMNFMIQHLDKMEVELSSIYEFSMEYALIKIQQMDASLIKDDEYFEEKEKELKEKVIILSHDQQTIISASDIKKLNKEEFSLNFIDGSVVVSEK